MLGLIVSMSAPATDPFTHESGTETEDQARSLASFILLGYTLLLSSFKW